MVATLLHGMAMALFKTLVGSVLNVWLMVDYRLLEGGAVHLLTRSDRGGRAPCRRLTTRRATTADIVFRDLILLMLTGFVTVAVLMLAHINPKAAAATRPGRRRRPATSWSRPAGRPSMDSDVDLWVQAPGDLPVGYSNKGGAVFNLLRDDLGHQLDLSGLNYESSYARGIVPGEYTVNLHLYRNRAADSDVPVTVIVSSKAHVRGRRRARS